MKKACSLWIFLLLHTQLLHKSWRVDGLYINLVPRHFPKHQENMLEFSEEKKIYEFLSFWRYNWMVSVLSDRLEMIEKDIQNAIDEKRGKLIIWG